MSETFMDHDYHKYSEQYARDQSFTFKWENDILGNDGKTGIAYIPEAEVYVTRYCGRWCVDDIRIKGYSLGIGGSPFETALYNEIANLIEADQDDIDEQAASKGVE